jgi:ATP-binding cassette subfamily B protein
VRRAARAARYLMALADRTDRRRLVIAAVLMAVGYLATPAIAYSLGRLTDSALDGRMTVTMLLAGGVAVLLVLELMCAHFAHLSYFELGELQQLALTVDLTEAANGNPGVERFDDPRFAEALTLVRDDLFSVRSALESVLQFGGVLVQGIVSTALLVSVEPWLALLPVAAIIPVVATERAQRLVDKAREATVSDLQLGRHLMELATSSSSAKEIRLFRAQDVVLDRHSAAWSSVTSALSRSLLRGAALRAVGQLLFICTYAAAVVLVAWHAVTGRASAGDVVVVITLSVQVGMQVHTGLGLLTSLHQAGHLVDRIERLRAWPTSRGRTRADSRPTEDCVIPPRLTSGIRLEGVTFKYPGTDRLVLDDVTLDIAAGSAVALVGDNGAGKSTLVKLLCGLYEPDAGRVLIDGVDLRDVAPDEWRARVAVLFQDFLRLELMLRENVGVGDIEAITNDERLHDALMRAEANDIASSVPGGLDGLLGRNFGDGVEVSGGQWQKLALARTLLSKDHLMHVLDEPAAALDAAVEHALFERFVAAASAARRASGSVTLFVSHRFSTVQLADHIVVLEQGGIVEQGTHSALLAQHGQYAEMFTMQARAYK